MKIAYFDMNSGASGDMTVAAFINCGFPLENLQKIFSKNESLKIELSTEKINRNSINVQKFNVNLKDEKNHRNFHDIKLIINDLDLSDKVKHDSIEAFKLLAETEGKMHGLKYDEIHFHEVGAVDSIVDIISIMCCMDFFGIQKIYTSRIPYPYGTIQCQHGTIPNPAPATLELLKGFPFYKVDISDEMITPTAACILKYFKNEGMFTEFTPEITGMGAGTRIIKNTPGFLRISIGEAKFD